MKLAIEAPYWLLLLPVWWIGAWLAARIRLRISYSGKGIKGGDFLAHVPRWGTALMLSLATLSLSRPVGYFPQERPALSTLWLVWDISESMFAQDILPDRRTYALEGFLRWLDSLEQNQAHPAIGIIFFAHKAYIALPPTRDWEAVRFALREGTRLHLGEGTDMADALAGLLSVARPGEEALLISDGAHNYSESPSLLALAQEARQKALPIHTWLVGKEGPQLYPEALQKISVLSGGGYYEGGLEVKDFLVRKEKVVVPYPLSEWLLLGVLGVGISMLAGMAIGGWFSVLTA